MIFLMNPNWFMGNMSNKLDVVFMLSIKENKVLKETNRRNVIRAKMRALDFRLLTCVEKERQEIEEELARLRFELDNVTK